MPTTRRESKPLTSWKEIAAYFGKGVRTVQRWEQQFGLPVSRPKNASKGFVLALPDELDQWLALNWSQPGKKNTVPGAGDSQGIAASIQNHRRLREVNRELMFDLTLAMKGLQGESEELARNLARPAKAETGTIEKRKPASASNSTRRRDSR